MVKRWCALTMVVFAGVLLSACASDKVPAETALKAAESAVNATVAEASKYVPDEAKALQDSLNSLKDSFTKGDYKTVLAGAPELTAKTKALADAAAAKKADLTKSWADVSGGLPKVLEAIQGRVDILSKAKTLPANLDKTAVDGAKTGLESMNKAWADAQASFSAGNLADALAKANALKGQAAEIMTKLGMQVPTALKS
ncbi:MAG TPA: hypothetical protein VFO08_02000 [Methylomirabilota bacterium]|jgi:hypothetical protein|nr:hypothetical protein [Methylomirabilota bacterium]